MTKAMKPDAPSLVGFCNLTKTKERAIGPLFCPVASYFFSRAANFSRNFFTFGATTNMQ